METRADIPQSATNAPRGHCQQYTCTSSEARLTAFPFQYSTKYPRSGSFRGSRQQTSSFHMRNGASSQNYRPPCDWLSKASETSDTSETWETLATASTINHMDLSLLFSTEEESSEEYAMIIEGIFDQRNKVPGALSPGLSSYQTRNANRSWNS